MPALTGLTYSRYMPGATDTVSPARAAFAASLIRRAYAAVVAAKKTVTDDSAAVELLGEPVKIFESNAVNLKITTAEDLQVAAGVLNIK